MSWDTYLTHADRREHCRVAVLADRLGCLREISVVAHITGWGWICPAIAAERNERRPDRVGPGVLSSDVEAELRELRRGFSYEAEGEELVRVLGRLTALWRLVWGRWCAGALPVGADKEGWVLGEIEAGRLPHPRALDPIPDYRMMEYPEPAVVDSAGDLG
jgi:hypothetical protein